MKQRGLENERKGRTILREREGRKENEKRGVERGEKRALTETFCRLFNEIFEHFDRQQKE